MAREIGRLYAIGIVGIALKAVKEVQGDNKNQGKQELKIRFR